MAKGNGNANSFLQFVHIERRQSEGFHLDTCILDKLEKYPQYIGEISGHTPTRDMVVEEALAFVFEEDKGFKKYLAELAAKEQPEGKTKKGRKAAANNQAEGAPTNLRPAA